MNELTDNIKEAIKQFITQILASLGINSAKDKATEALKTSLNNNGEALDTNIDAYLESSSLTNQKLKAKLTTNLTADKKETTRTEILNKIRTDATEIVKATLQDKRTNLDAQFTALDTKSKDPNTNKEDLRKETEALRKQYTELNTEKNVLREQSIRALTEVENIRTETGRNTVNSTASDKRELPIDADAFIKSEREKASKINKESRSAAKSTNNFEDRNVKAIDIDIKLTQSIDKLKAQVDKATPSFTARLIEQYSSKAVNDAFTKRLFGGAQSAREREINNQITSFFEQNNEKRRVGGELKAAATDRGTYADRLDKEAAQSIDTLDPAKVTDANTKIDQEVQKRVEAFTKKNPSIDVTEKDKNILALEEAKKTKVAPIIKQRQAVVERDKAKELKTRGDELIKEADTEIVNNPTIVPREGRRSKKSSRSQEQRKRQAQTDFERSSSDRLAPDGSGLGRTGRSPAERGNELGSSIGKKLGSFTLGPSVSLDVASKKETPTFAQEKRKEGRKDDRSKATTLNDLRDLGSDFSRGGLSGDDVEFSSKVEKVINLYIRGMAVK
jgi:hypothetical protein